MYPDIYRKIKQLEIVIFVFLVSETLALASEASTCPPVNNDSLYIKKLSN